MGKPFSQIAKGSLQPPITGGERDIMKPNHVPLANEDMNFLNDVGSSREVRTSGLPPTPQDSNHWRESCLLAGCSKNQLFLEVQERKAVIPDLRRILSSILSGRVAATVLHRAIVPVVDIPVPEKTIPWQMIYTAPYSSTPMDKAYEWSVRLF